MECLHLERPYFVLYNKIKYSFLYSVFPIVLFFCIRCEKQRWYIQIRPGPILARITRPSWVSFQLNASAIGTFPPIARELRSSKSVKRGQCTYSSNTTRPPAGGVDKQSNNRFEHQWPCKGQRCFGYHRPSDYTQRSLVNTSTPLGPKHSWRVGVHMPQLIFEPWTDQQRDEDT